MPVIHLFVRCSLLLRDDGINPDAPPLIPMPFVTMIRTLILVSSFAVAVHAADAPNKAKPKRPYAAEVNPKDAKNTPSGKPLPHEDPTLAQFSIDEKTAQLPAVSGSTSTATTPGSSFSLRSSAPTR